MKVVFLTQRLAVGGAERQLVSLAKGLVVRGHSASIATFYPGGDLADGLAEAGVRHTSIGKRGRYDAIGPFRRFASMAAAEKPDVVYSWLTVPNIVAGLVKAAGGRWPLVCGIRHAVDDFSVFDWLARVTDRVEPYFSRFADRIVANSEAGRTRAIAVGFPPARLSVLPNGIDIDVFRPDREAGLALRRVWGIPDDAVLVGHPARIDPTKGHDTFLAAAERLMARNSNLYFVCPGTGDAALAARLQDDTRRRGLSDRLLWPGLVLNMPAAYCALDLAVMCSSAEGWPNVVGEALSCGTPMVVTDVGDAARIVPSGMPVVPPDDSQALAMAIEAAIATRAASPADMLHRHIRENFSRSAMIERAEKLLLSVAAGKQV